MGKIELGGSVNPKLGIIEGALMGGRAEGTICGENNCCGCWGGGGAWEKGVEFAIVGKAVSGDW